jgi:hypothetical protein
MAAGNTSSCYQVGLLGWGGSVAYDTPEGTNGGWPDFAPCEDDRPNWSAGAIANARRAVVNTVWSQSDALSTGKWKQRPGTIAVKSASVMFSDNDVSKALSLMCNGVENCSVPGGTIITRLGADARYNWPAKVDVQYQCGGETTNRTASFAAGEDVVLTCNVQSAIAGVYVNTAHDANPGRGPEDTVFVGVDTSQPPANPLLARWTWTPSNATQPAYTLSNSTSSWSSLESNDASSNHVKLQWGEQGHPVKIESVNGASFDWTAPAVETLPVVPKQ